MTPKLAVILSEAKEPCILFGSRKTLPTEKPQPESYAKRDYLVDITYKHIIARWTSRSPRPQARSCGADIPVRVPGSSNTRVRTAASPAVQPSKAREVSSVDASVHARVVGRSRRERFGANPGTDGTYPNSRLNQQKAPLSRGAFDPTQN
jgi:hypothetical protein